MINNISATNPHRLSRQIASEGRSVCVGKLGNSAIAYFVVVTALLYLAACATSSERSPAQPRALTGRSYVCYCCFFLWFCFLVDRIEPDSPGRGPLRCAAWVAFGFASSLAVTLTRNFTFAFFCFAVVVDSSFYFVHLTFRGGAFGTRYDRLGAS